MHFDCMLMILFSIFRLENGTAKAQPEYFGTFLLCLLSSAIPDID